MMENNKNLPRKNNRTMHLSVSLAFTIKENKSIMGLLRTYVIKCNKMETVFAQTTRIAKDFVELNPNAKYKGIVDANVVSGPLKEGEILGWERFNNIQTLSSARKFAKSGSSAIGKLVPEELKDYWGLSFIYFCEDPIQSKNNFGFSILTILKASSRPIERANQLATEKKITNKIAKFSNGEVPGKNIHYIGAKDFFKLSARNLRSGNYQSFYKRIKSEKEVQELILNKSELNKTLKLIF